MLLRADTPKVGPSADGGTEANTHPAQQEGLSTAFERHYSANEIAKLWKLSVDSVRRIFEREPGVLLVGDSNPRGKRRYRTLRIPESVVEQVHRRRSLYL
jgi:hypothetical protein